MCACRTLYPWFKAVITFCLYGVSLLRNCDNIQLAHICSILLEFTFRMHILPSSTRCCLRLSKRKRKDKLNGILLLQTWISPQDQHHHHSSNQKGKQLTCISWPHDWQRLKCPIRSILSHSRIFCRQHITACCKFLMAFVDEIDCCK